MNTENRTQRRTNEAWQKKVREVLQRVAVPYGEGDVERTMADAMSGDLPEQVRLGRILMDGFRSAPKRTGFRVAPPGFGWVVDVSWIEEAP